MMKKFFNEKIRSNHALRNTLASYSAFVSKSVASLLMVPLLVHFLDREQLGLWALVNQIIAYLMWMDFGVSEGAGRMMADAIVHKNQRDINRWWTASWCVLILQALLVGFLGCALTSPFLDFYQFDGILRIEGAELFILSTLIAACSLPLRIYPGILTAQRRFHWVPVWQGIQPWIHLMVMAVFLASGWGLKSYPVANACVVICSLIFYNICLKRGPSRMHWDKSGIEIHRFKKLFKFSGSLLALGLGMTVVGSVPALLIGKKLGVAVVPIYTFTSRFPAMIRSLILRTRQAFFPEIQELYVKGDIKNFQKRWEKALQTALVVALGTSLVILAVNRSVVTFLCGAEFYGGIELTLLVLLVNVSMCIVGGLTNILQAAGKMGKIWLVSLIEATGTIAAALFLMNLFGMHGAILAVAIVPVLSRGIYAVYLGAKLCNSTPLALAGNLFLQTACVVFVIGGAVFVLKVSATANSLWLTWSEWGCATFGLLIPMVYIIYKQKYCKI